MPRRTQTQRISRAERASTAAYAQGKNEQQRSHQKGSCQPLLAQITTEQELPYRRHRKRTHQSVGRSGSDLSETCYAEGEGEGEAEVRICWIYIVLILFYVPSSYPQEPVHQTTEAQQDYGSLQQSQYQSARQYHLVSQTSSSQGNQ